MEVGINIAEKCISEGIRELGEVVKSKNMQRDIISNIQNKIDMGNRRKCELQETLNVAKRQKQDLLEMK